MKDNQSVKPVINMEARTITFQTRGLPDQVLHMDKVHAVNKERAAYTGMAQVRIVDAAAIPAADAKTGAIIPIEVRLAMKHERMGRLIAHYETGSPDWSIRGESTPRTSQLVAILAVMQPSRPLAEVKAFVDGLAKHEKAALEAKYLPKPAEDAIEAATAKLEEFLTA